MNKIKCRICNKEFKSITATHLMTHGLTIRDYVSQFNIMPGELTSDDTRKKKATASKDHWINKYGPIDGLKRWNAYRERQRYTNTFEYKQQEKGWSKQEFDEYNKSRAVTLENMIYRYGVIEGKARWKSYVDAQRTNGSSEQWFINKLGEAAGKARWKAVCNTKAHTIDSYTHKYGEDLGTQKYLEYMKNKRNQEKFVFSQKSQEFFNKLITEFPEDRSECMHFQSKDFEYIIHTSTGAKFVDFFDTTAWKCIEFFGDYWHGNPNKYTKDDQIRGVLVEDIWNKDSDRISSIMQSAGCDVLVIWESEVDEDVSKAIEKCKRFLNDI